MIILWYFSWVYSFIYSILSIFLLPAPYNPLNSPASPWLLGIHPWIMLLPSCQNDCVPPHIVKYPDHIKAHRISTNSTIPRDDVIIPTITPYRLHCDWSWVEFLSPNTPYKHRCLTLQSSETYILYRNRICWLAANRSSVRLDISVCIISVRKGGECSGKKPAFKVIKSKFLHFFIFS